jgi:mannosyltransferase
MTRELDLYSSPRQDVAPFPQEVQAREVEPQMTPSVKVATPNSPAANRHRQGRLMVLLLLLAFGWRIVGLTEQSFWRDEVDVIYLSIRPLSETMSMFISPAQNGPLYYLLIRPWLHLVGSSEFAVRYTSVLFGTLAVPLLWQTARRLLPGDRRFDLGNAPMLAALFLSLNPYQIWYGQEAKMYALIMCTTLLSSWSWLEAMRRGGTRRWLQYLLVTSLSIYTHLMTALILPLHFVWFLLAWPLNWKRWLGYAATSAGFVLPYLPLIWWQWHYLTTLEYETGYQFTPFIDVVRILLLDHTRGALFTVWYVWLIPIFFLGLVGILVGYPEMVPREQKNSPLLPLGAASRLAIVISWLILPVLFIHGVSLIKPIFVDRYVIWIGSAFVMLMALGVQVVRHSGGRWAKLLAALLVSYTLIFWGWTTWQQTSTPQKTQLRQAINYVAERRTANDLLILQIPHTHHAYRYYTSDFSVDPFQGSEARLAPWMEGIWTRSYQYEETAMAHVDEQMRQRTAGYPEAWLLLVEANSWDPRRLMDRWLEMHGKLVEYQQFHGVEARRYRLQQ